MYIESVPNRNSPPAILLRESYREGGKVKKRTLLNLSDWPPERIAGFKALLKGGTVIPSDQEAISIVRSLPHGHVAAALGTARKIGLDRLIGPEGDRRRDLVLALAVSRILDPGSKLAAARALSPETAGSSLGAELGLGSVDEEELYGALDWLAVRQAAIETALARCHLSGGTLVLYDVTSSYMEGRCSPGKSGDVMAAISRSSNSDIWNAPPSRRPRIAGARSAVIQSSPAGLMSSVMRASVIMPLSPTRTTWPSPKRCFSLATWAPRVDGSPVEPSKTSMATGQPSGAQSRP